MAKTVGGVRNGSSSRISSSKVMVRAHKYYKLYGGKMSFSESVKLAWRLHRESTGKISPVDYKAAADKAYLDKMRKEHKGFKSAQRSSYDDLSIPESAFYTNNKRGRFGSKFVGD
mgnify:CR=1 FL=1